MAAIPRKESNHDPRPGDAAFTVRELLRLPLFLQARLVAGERGLQGTVARVNVMEVPDIEPWVRAGDLLVTTGYPFREDQGKLLQLIPELAKRGIAALGIQTKRFIDEVPKEVIEEAERQRIPLIELPPDMSFSDVVRTVMENVLAQEAALLADLQNRISSMTRLLLDGSGLYAFLDAMEMMLGNPVAVVREQEKPWLSEGLRNADPVEVWPVVQSLTFRHVGRGLSNGFVLLQNSFRAYVNPIPAQRMKQACLVLLERNRDIVPIDVLSVERLSSLAGLELANVEAVREVEGKYLDQFLQDWLLGKFVSESDWKLRAEVCGCTIPEQTPLCAVVVGMTDPAPPAEKLRELARRLRSERLRVVDALLAAPVGGDLVLIVPVPESLRPEAQAEASPTGLLQRLLTELRPLLGDPELKLYSGRVAERADRLPASLSQAKRARQVAEVCGLLGEVVTYDRLGVYSLLYLIPSSEEREQFLQRFSLPLQQADKKGGGRLMETLEMFFRCNGNIKLTSEKLFAHYNTIVYRLDKIQSILGVSLDDPEDRLQLQLSLKLGQITPGSSGAI
ncbi:PucR family transcriptional regulator [Cohnella fermenti]|nr:PucR family transcriptional regulator [Cohnella fermenti]